MDTQDFRKMLEQVLVEAEKAGVDHERLLASVYADHMVSDEHKDPCHIYGITFGTKLQEEMELASARIKH